MSPSDNPSAAREAGDPFELWRQIYETNERAWNAVLERTVNNPAFAESSSKILETFLAAQKTVRDNMRQYLEQINMPTREDIARLGELIVALEEKIDQVDDRLAGIERSLASLDASTKPSSSSSPPSGVRRKSGAQARSPKRPSA
jgi:polyhydroxyalkanoic acid synthase PhaR subunit